MEILTTMNTYTEIKLIAAITMAIRYYTIKLFFLFISFSCIIAPLN